MRISDWSSDVCSSDLSVPSSSRPLTTGEIALARTVFGAAIAYDRVRICHHKWIFFQPRPIGMAPMGSIHFNPHGYLYCDDFSPSSHPLHSLFHHPMPHLRPPHTRGCVSLVLLPPP